MSRATVKGPVSHKVAWEKTLLRESGLSLPCMAVLVALASYGNADGTRAHPTQARLAADLGVTERTVRRWLDEGREAGWIEVTGHRGRTAVYRLTIPAERRGPREPEPESAVLMDEVQPDNGDRATGQFFPVMRTVLSGHEDSTVLLPTHDQVPTNTEDQGHSLPVSSSPDQDAPAEVEDVWTRAERKAAEREAAERAARATEPEPPPATVEDAPAEVPEDPWARAERLAAEKAARELDEEIEAMLAG